uniref:Uncharacterized protein n=1 Tax=Pectinophora gossypiella TaxID=13191 RepID=A0A1E1WUZ0_PECGO
MFLYQVVHHPQCNIVKLPASLPTIFRSRKIQLCEAENASVPSCSQSSILQSDIKVTKVTKRKFPTSLSNAPKRRKIQVTEPKEHDYTDTPRKKKLKLMLERKRVLSETRLKKLRAARQANRRLVKKNAELSDVIAELRLNFKF